MLPRIGKAHHSSFSSGDCIAQYSARLMLTKHMTALSTPPTSHRIPHVSTFLTAIPILYQHHVLGAKPPRPSTSPATAVRASQVIYQSGFLNQHSLTSPHNSTSLTKGWSPRKVLLQGTKPFFYKPPKDKAGDIRELFPTCLTAGAAPESMVFVSHFGNGDSHFSCEYF